MSDPDNSPEAIFAYYLGEYLHEAYRRGMLDGIDQEADGAAPNRWFNQDAVDDAAADLRNKLADARGQL